MATAAAQPHRASRAKRASPRADGFVADLYPALGQQVLDVPVTQMEPEVQPHGMADDLRRKAGAPVERVTGGRGWHNRHHQSVR